MVRLYSGEKGDVAEPRIHSMTGDVQRVRLQAALQGLRFAAAASLALYLAWNAYWLSRAEVPPLLFTALTGLPCPTTGGVRSAAALLHGDLAGSLRMNPMTVPISLLFLVSAGWPLVMLFRGRRASLPLAIFWCWAIVLAVAWAGKLLGDRQYW